MNLIYDIYDINMIIEIVIFLIDINSACAFIYLYAYLLINKSIINLQICKFYIKILSLRKGLYK